MSSSTERQCDRALSGGQVAMGDLVLITPGVAHKQLRATRDVGGAVVLGCHLHPDLNGLGYMRDAGVMPSSTPIREIHRVGPEFPSWPSGMFDWKSLLES